MKLLTFVLVLVSANFIGGQSWYFPDSVSTSTRKSNKRISELKCDLYKKSVKKSHFVSGLIISPQKPQEFQTSDCDLVTGLIVGGTKTKVGEFPHMAAIGWETLEGLEFACGGSLISDRFVLTVAHCGKKGRDKPSIVRLGDQNLGSLDDGAHAIEVKIQIFLKHENYNARSRINDIALIKLDQSVRFTKYIRPACLEENEYFGNNVTATGWGQTGQFSSTSDELLKVALKVVDDEKCLEKARDDLRINSILDSQLCAGGQEGKDTCQGDSGGPIQVPKSDNSCIYSIVGLTSYGAHCGSNIPSIYTRVSSYLDWIEKNVW